MATATLTKPLADADCWNWSVELDADTGQCRFKLSREALLLISGSIAALDGATTAELDAIGWARRRTASQSFKVPGNGCSRAAAT